MRRRSLPWVFSLPFALGQERPPTLLMHVMCLFQVNGSKIRHIGVTNYDVPRLMEMLDAGVPIVSNQAGLPSAVCAKASTNTQSIRSLPH